MPLPKGTSVNLHHHNTLTWDTHKNEIAATWNAYKNEMAVRMPPNGGTSASQRISGQTNHPKPLQRDTAKHHQPDFTHNMTSLELNTPYNEIATETIDTPSPYKMDEEMQRDQELLTAALNNEEKAYKAYKDKIDKWNAQHKTPEEPLNTSKKIGGIHVGRALAQTQQTSQGVLTIVKLQP